MGFNPFKGASMRITGLVIVDNSVQHLNVKFEQIQELVGGSMDTVSSKEVVAWFGELAGFKNLERNYLAEEVGKAIGIDLENVHGPVVITGAWDKSGNETNVPAWINKAAIEVSELILI